MTGYGSKCVFLNSLTTPGCAHPSNGGELATYRRGLKFAWWGAWVQPVNVAGIFIRKNTHRLWAFRVIIRYQENGVLGYWALQYSPDTGRASPSNATYTATFLYSCFFCALFASGVNTYGVCRQVRPLRFYVICNSLCTGTTQCVVIANLVFGANIFPA